MWQAGCMLCTCASSVSEAPCLATMPFATSSTSVSVWRCKLLHGGFGDHDDQTGAGEGVIVACIQ